MKVKINNFNKITEKRLGEQPKRVYKKWEHAGWGNVINWEGYPRISGCLPRRPKKGDELIDILKSGMVAVFEIVDVEYIHDPPDMFFATVNCLGQREPNEEEQEVYQRRQQGG